MSRKGHSFLHEYPRIRVDRFTESRERVPSYLRRPVQQAASDKVGNCGDTEETADAPWQDLELAGPSDFFPHPTVQLLTHIHLDHLEGLDTPLYNGAPIYCSHQTKEMLLRLEPGPSRTAGEAGAQMGSHGRKRPYEWLKVTEQEVSVRRREVGSSVAPRDVLHTLPLNTPTTIPYLPGLNVRITLLDANHMPGAVMFLVEGHRGAVLHTGDCRAEKWWLEALVRNPIMQRYTSWEEAKAVTSREEMEESMMLRSQAEQIEATQTEPAQFLSQSCDGESTPSDTQPCRDLEDRRSTISKSHEAAGYRDLRLKNIYIDDEGIASPEWPMAKKDAVIDLIGLMERYPSDTNFFIDLYTWGYEDIYLAIGKTFSRRSAGPRVHVDAYKKKMYAAASDPVVSFLTTKTTTRFHACERKGECEYLSPDERLAGERDAFESLSQHWAGPAPMPPSAEEIAATPSPRQRQGALTVYVKPISSSKKDWKVLNDKLHQEISRANEGKNPYPLWLACPIGRHSTLPELQRFVRAFRPATVTPTTSHPDHYFLAARYLGPALGPGGPVRIVTEAKAAIGQKHWTKYETALRSTGGSDDPVTVAAEVRQLREALRHTLDLSQSPRGDITVGLDRDGYDADVSGMPSAFVPPSATSATQAIHLLPKRNRVVSHPPVSVPLRKVQQVHTNNDSGSDSEADRTFAAPNPPAAAMNSTTTLSEDLARRYFIVLRMFIEPGLRLKNLPGGTEGPQAWRAVRKLRPDYARRTEEIMHKEVGVVPPPWTRSKASAPAPDPSPVPVPSGVQATPIAPEGQMAPHEEPQQEARRQVEVEKIHHENWEPPSQERSGLDVPSARSPPHTSLPLTEGQVEQPKVSTDDYDWLLPLLTTLCKQPLDPHTWLPSQIRSTLEAQRSTYASILTDSLTRPDSLVLLRRHSTELTSRLSKAFEVWSSVLSPEAGNNTSWSTGGNLRARKWEWEELRACASCTEVCARLAALLLTSEAGEALPDDERATFCSNVCSAEEMTRTVLEEQSGQRDEASLLSSPSSFVGRMSQDVSDENKTEWSRWITRVEATLRFAIQENQTEYKTNLPNFPFFSNPES